LDGEGAEELRVVLVYGGEVLLVALEAFEAVGFDGEDAFAVGAGECEVSGSGDEDDAAGDHEAGEEEEPACVEGDEGGWGVLFVGWRVGVVFSRG